MKLSEAFPSNFLKADDLQGRDVTVTIQDVEFDVIGKDNNEGKKLILSFSGKEKKMVCNKTNATTIAQLYGDDTDHWIGQRIIVGPREVEYQGKMTWALRVSLRKPTSAAVNPPPQRRAEPEPEPVGAPAGADNLSPDEIPF